MTSEVVVGTVVMFRSVKRFRARFLLGHSKSFVFQIGHPRPLFVIFVFSPKKYRIKTLYFNGIRTRIDGVEGEHADHLTTTTAQQS